MSEMPEDPTVSIAGAEVTLIFFYEDGDMATVSVTGFERGITAMRALVQAGDETVIHGLFDEFSKAGDVSMLEMFDAIDYEDGQNESDDD